MQKGIKPEDIIYQKVLLKNDNITNGRNFYNQPTDSDLKQQKELES